MLYGIEAQTVGGHRIIIEQASVDVSDLHALVEFGKRRKTDLRSEYPLAMDWRIIHYGDANFTERVDEVPLP